ncbi:hypothetical protein ACFL6Y_08455 [Elusimicrobiota bacterium]
MQENKPNQIQETVQNIPQNQKYQTKNIRVEMRTSTERIEGFVKIPAEAQSYCKRLSDILWYADRGGSGILALANAFVYDLQTNKMITRQSLLGISKAQITYFWILPQENEREPFVLDLSAKNA